MDWIIENWDEIVKAVGLIIAAASIIVRLTPTLRDDSALLPVIKFLGKYIALDKYGTNEVERPK
jgi:hypothetical protein